MRDSFGEIVSSSVGFIDTVGMRICWGYGQTGPIAILENGCKAVGKAVNHSVTTVEGIS